MGHLLVTNDFPPKVGGIQSYLWELWRRLPASEVTVLTTAHPDAARFDAEQAFRVVRRADPVLLPTPAVVRAVRSLATEVGATAVVLDPALPVGAIGPRLGLPYAVVLHGAEITVPGRLPVSRLLLRRVLREASLVIAGGGYPEAEATRAAGRELPTVCVPPGVDTEVFAPLDAGARAEARVRLGLPVEGRLVVSVSRLVPRKGFDVLIRAAAALSSTHPDLTVAICGAGRDERRLRELTERTAAPVRFLGRLPGTDLPALYGCADVFAMLCRNRWGGLEQEGFGIVFLEAAAAGVASVAGDSGGAGDAVVDGETGVIVDRPEDPEAVAAALAALLDDPGRRAAMGRAGRARAETSFTYDLLADRLHDALGPLGSATR
jgi:phosphatidylinositol alpha-1,6-mannosyltransferase